MADIKAKDISVAQSVSANDLILGSSIAGTTANIKVDVLGAFIANIQQFSTIGGKTLLQNLSSINKFISDFKNIKRTPTVSFENTTVNWEYTGSNITLSSNKLYIIWAETKFMHDRPQGIGISDSMSQANFIASAEVEVDPNPKARVFGTSPIIIKGEYSQLFIWRRSNGITGSDPINFAYIEIE